MADKQLRVIIVGDAKSVQKAFRDTEQSSSSAAQKVAADAQKIADADAKRAKSAQDAADKAVRAAQQSAEKQAQAAEKATGFTKLFAGEFAKLGGAAALGARAANVAVDVLHDLGQAVQDYNVKMQSSRSTILGVTQDQGKLTEAFAFAESELKAGRAAYSDTVAAIAELTPTAKRTGQDVRDLYRTMQLLSTLNSGPGGGTEGALVAINNALSGQFTSLQERFNLPTAEIQAAVRSGVPALQAINDALAKQGVTMDLVNAKAKDYGNQAAIAKDQSARLAAEVGKPIFQALAQGLTEVNKQLASSEWQKYSEEYGQFVSLLVKSLHSWTALSGVGEQLGIQIEKGLRDTLLGIPELAQDFVGGIAQAFGVKADVIAKARGLNPLTKLYDAWTQKIEGDQSKLDQWFKDNFADPVADAAKGNTPGSQGIAPARMQGYGQAVIAEYVKGLTSAQIGDFEQFIGKIGDLFANGFKGADGQQNTEQMAAAQSLLAQALKEVAQDGQISETTLQRLSTVFGKGTAEVQRLVIEYGRMQAAQQAATAATEGLARAQANLSSIQAAHATDLKSYERDIAAATATATANAEAAAAAIEQQQGALAALGKEAEAVARADQAAIDGLQAAATANAEANQRAIADAQAALAAATEQRKRDADIAQAAINGTTEAYERQTEGLTEQDRALAAHYETIIGGERRAKDAADERLNGLNKAANKEDLDFLTRIHAAREKGNTKEANALQRQYDARKKQRNGEIEIARAQAAVAGDEFDTKAKQIDKEAAKKDEADAAAEKQAGKRLSEVQAQADAQAKADAAAIKGAQDAARADAERYAAQQRGIQDEIDKIGEAQRAQGIKDKQAITDAQTLKTERENVWKVEEAGATVALGFAQKIATENGKTAQAAKDTYDADVARAPFAQANADNAEREANARKITATVGGGQQNPLVDNAPTTPQSTGALPPAAPVTPQPKGAPNLPPLYDANTSQYPPPGYYKVLDSTLHAWYVPNGYRLSDYGIDEAKPGGGSGGTNLPGGGTGTPQSNGGGGGALSLREAGTPATAGGDIHLHINAPNLTDIGNPAQQRAFAAQAGAASRRAWDDLVRGGGGVA